MTNRKTACRVKARIWAPRPGGTFVHPHVDRAQRRGSPIRCAPALTAWPAADAVAVVAVAVAVAVDAGAVALAVTAVAVAVTEVAVQADRLAHAAVHHAPTGASESAAGCG